MLEELGELSIALHERDLIEAADGFTDLLYVTYGAAVSYGLRMDDAFAELDWPDDVDKAILEFEVDAAKSVASSVLSMSWCSCDCVDCGKDRMRSYDALRLELSGLVVTITKAAAGLGLPLEALFREVHRSNMTKTFTPTKTGMKYGEGGGKGPGYSPPDIAGVLRQFGREPSGWWK
jgi:hypothetical protein